MTLKRPKHPMPSYIRTAMTRAGVTAAYRQRPAYQRNDYIRWIAAAKLETTREKRLKQMIRELEGGSRYMSMKWSPRK
jgi:hypothetical protein